LRNCWRDGPRGCACDLDVVIEDSRCAASDANTSTRVIALVDAAARHIARGNEYLFSVQDFDEGILTFHTYVDHRDSQFREMRAGATLRLAF